MKEYIINYPHLQSIRRRVGGIAVSLVCWMMWIYLLIPLITLTGWLAGDRSFNDEMRWFGGDKSLLELLEIYAVTLLVLVIIWIGWILLNIVRRPKRLLSAQKMVKDDGLCRYYRVEQDQLSASRKARWVTVSFDPHGQILKLDTETPPDRIG
ncbi:MAG: poly-beta-1,6-N-acetyl-D-glucosamine biosynthesis protein PgaD [Methylobacter sp.]|nr:MAG: poly-beta-1,6-N-acetyl-D-glucosamine biosynthesis protein PgaD [Methylobacter sp.]PPD24430.1 MAG: poly-beta-1,6-N-acetyl-D-glucosamine biosynthesis protein PgaD [Methylobacter sp.]